jgi:anti-sigma B factor antagonist
MTKRPVSVHQVPNNLSSATQMEVLRRLEMAVEGAHPRFVLDCSQLDSLGAAEVYFLLCCLEEAMKHNGDLRLAALRPHVKAALHQAGIAHMFEVYDTTEHAVHSYQVRTGNVVSLPREIASPATGVAA